MVTTNQHIEIRPNRAGQDRAYIAGTRTRVQDIVLMQERFGQTADEIANRHFRHLTLAQIHDALSFFHEDRQAIWNCIREDEEYAAAVRADLAGGDQPPHR